MDKLIEEGKVNKAKVIALAMTKMPLDKFGYTPWWSHLQKDTTKLVKS
jgi:hypothetical protein